MGHGVSKSNKPPPNAPADTLNADALDVICSFCDEQTLVSNLAHASKAVASAVDAHAAARARAYWNTSAELERRGVRLGAAFLARRSRPPRKAADGSRIRLASRRLKKTPEEKLAFELNQEVDWSPEWWAAKKEKLSAEALARCEPIFGHELDEDAIKEIGYDYEKAGRRPSALRLPGRVLLVDVVVRDINDRVVGRRSVLVDGAEPLLAPGEREDSEESAWADELRFKDSLRIASGLEPDWLFRDLYGPGENEARNRLDHGWLTEVCNVVGAHQCVNVSPPRRSILGSSEINHDWPDQQLEHGYVDEYRPSQLPKNRRFVSVRVDLFRLSDGMSMCLGEHDVGVKVWWDWPGLDQREGYGAPMINDDLSFIPLTAADDFWEEDGIFKRPDLFGPQCHVIADYPDEGTGELHIRGVRLGFCCPAYPDWDDVDGHEKMHDFQNNPRLGDRVVRSLRRLDAWT
jgi:hypothetical protein